MALLPTKKSQKAHGIENDITLIYGLPKIGKSTFVSGFENALFLDSEGGLSKLNVYKTPIDSWETFVSVYKELAEQVKAGKCPFKPLVFDTIDNIYMMCMDYICKKKGIDHPSDLDYGKGWNTVKREFVAAMQKYRALGLGVIYISHAAGSEIKSRTGTYTRYDTTMPGTCASIITPSCDFILYAHGVTAKDGSEKRVLETKPSQYWNAGDRTGALPETMPLNYAEFMKVFNEITK